MPSLSGTQQAPEDNARGGREWLRQVPASLVTFLVAVPLSMGIALASGAPTLSGLLSAVLGGVLVGALSGAPLQVSGPAAGLVVLAHANIERFGFRGACLVTFLAGLLQLAFGAARVARLALALSPAVLHGMLAGIGAHLVLSQLRVVLGGVPRSSALQNLRELPGQLATLEPRSAALGALTLGLLWFAPRLLRGRLAAVPPAMIAVAAGSLVAWAVRWPVARVVLPSNWSAAVQLPALPSSGDWPATLTAALVLAVVASAESLLSSVATDKLHTGPRAKLDRELVAQGAGNTLAGLLGGLPITGVIVRSTANIAAGATTRLSTMLHGVWVLLAVSFASGLLRAIPLAVLGGLLVAQGLKLLKPEQISELRRHRQLSVYFATFAGVLCVNLLAGILLGLVVAAARLLFELARCELEAESDGDQWRVHARGALTFVGVPRLHATLARVPAGARVVLHLDVDALDHAAQEALDSWRTAHERSGGVVALHRGPAAAAAGFGLRAA